MDFMKAFEGQKGVAFFLLYFTRRDIYYYLTYREAATFWDRGKGGRPEEFSCRGAGSDLFFPRSGGLFHPLSGDASEGS